MERILGVLCFLFVAAACGGGEEKAPPGGGAPPEEAAPAEGTDDVTAAYDPAKATAVVKGVVRLEGDPPRRAPLDLGAEKFCHESHKDAPLLSETFVVGDGGALANVFIHVTKGLEGWKFPKASGEAVLDQRGCRYEPHVLGMQAGWTLKVRNSDPITHNVHGFTMADDRDFCNWGQSKQGWEDSKEVRKPGFLFVKCDVHGWMGSYVCATRWPFFAVTKENGAFSLEKLPAGTYVVEAWHEKLGKKSETVTVGDGETKELSFAFSR